MDLPKKKIKCTCLYPELIKKMIFKISANFSEKKAFIRNSICHFANSRRFLVFLISYIMQIKRKVTCGEKIRSRTFYGQRLWFYLFLPKITHGVQAIINCCGNNLYQSHNNFLPEKKIK